uniref:Uncharacterized protein n=1 Tax=Trichogramma kaykai TaxID=54128 RepID=A0ABD2VYI5_9HYME
MITRIDVYIYIKCIRVGIKFVLHATSATGSNITLVSIYIRLEQNKIVFESYTLLAF